MVLCCWSAKGGSGTSVVSVALALSLARTAGDVLLIDLAGDIPAVLGLPGFDSPGLTDWLGAGAAVPADALARLEAEVAPGLWVVPRGSGPFVAGSPQQAQLLTSVLSADQRPVVIDAGTLIAPSRGGQHTALGHVMAAASDRSLLVTRACCLALRRATEMEVRPHGVVLVVEEGRALDAADVASVVGAPVLAEVEVDPAVARAVDAGILASRLPRRLERSLREVA